MLTSEEFLIIKKAIWKRVCPLQSTALYFDVLQHCSINYYQTLIDSEVSGFRLFFSASLVPCFLLPCWLIYRTLLYCGRNSRLLLESDNATKWIITHIKWLNNKFHLTEPNVLLRHWFIVFFFRNTINLMTMWNRHYCVLFLRSTEALMFKWCSLLSLNKTHESGNQSFLEFVWVV